MRKTRSRNQQGKIIPNGVKPEPHEMDTILFFTGLGKDVELLEKSRTPHTKSPDIFMCSKIWEIKSPTGLTMRAIERIMHRATQQSQNVIMDLRRTKIHDEDLIVFLKKKFVEMRSMRNLWIITKKLQIIKLRK